MYPKIVLGPPGVGKTTRLLQMVEADLAAGVAPEEIMTVTFTRRGAQEAAGRAAEKFGLDKGRLRWFRTIHSLCFQAAGVSNGDVLEGKKLLEFGDWLGVRVSESFSMDEGSTFGYEPADRALFMENLARVRCVSLREQYDANDDGLGWDFVDRIARGLARFKQDRHLVDFSDMLAQFVEGSWCPEIRKLYVDEFQDLSELQIRVIEKIVDETGCDVTIFGDDDQSIYRWSGAATDRFIDMPGDVTVLGQSWRVPSLVQNLAHEVISRVRHRRPKEWKPRALDDEMRGKGFTLEGKINRVQKIYDADVWGSDVLILGRNAWVLKPVLEHLRREGCIYEWRGHPSVSGVTLEAILGWEALRAGKSVTADEARRVYDRMSSGKGVRRGFKTLPGLGGDEVVDMSYLKEKGGLNTDRIWHEALDRVPQDERVYMLRALQKGEKLRRKPRVRVSTMHGAKGGEADHVIVLREMASRTYREMLDNPEDEHRVQYVALTRTRQTLTIVAPNSRSAYNV